VIPVSRKAEPVNFDADVRRPGLNYLASTTSPNFKRNRYWSNAATELNYAYNKICAYSCFYLASPGSVDHFLPKVKHPQLAYEWNNYRLAHPRVNSRKGDSEEIIDPFVVQDGWFTIDFPSCLVMAGAGLPDLITGQINKTISILGLNDDDFLVQERCDIMMSFAEGELALTFLQRRWPFLAAEIVRQGIEMSARDIFKKRT